MDFRKQFLPGVADMIKSNAADIAADRAKHADAEVPQDGDERGEVPSRHPYGVGRPQSGLQTMSKKQTFKDYFNLSEAFDNPYKFQINRNAELTTYTFTVDDVAEPYTIEATFDDDRILSNFINRASIDMYDQYVAEYYPEALNPASAKVHEYAFTDKATGELSKNTKSGHSATRTIGTIIHIAAHYIQTREPTVILFTGAKEENRGKIYDLLVRNVLKSGEFPHYFYFKDEYKDSTRFWVFDSRKVPYMDDETFQEFLEIERLHIDAIPTRYR